MVHHFLSKNLWKIFDKHVKSGRRRSYYIQAITIFCASALISFITATVFLASYFIKKPLLLQNHPTRTKDGDATPVEWKTCEIRLKRIEEPKLEVLADPKLVHHIRQNVLMNLSKNERLKQLNEDPSEGQFMSKLIVPKFFSNISIHLEKKFFEAGALDGKFASTTFYLEKTLGWTGLLAEANPRKIPEIIHKSGRSVLFAPVCLSPETRPCKGTYGVAHLKNITADKVPNDVYWYGKILYANRKKKKAEEGWTVYTAPVDCYPLYSLLAAANLTRLDFLSLDVESIEPHVLKTIPWDHFHAKVVRLDLHAGRTYARYKKFAIDFLQARGYYFHRNLLDNPYVGVNDAHIFSKIDAGN